MIYILIGIFALTSVLGGFKKMYAKINIQGGIFAVILGVVIILELVPKIFIKNEVYLSIGGIILMLFALFLAFYKNTFYSGIYIINISLILGIIFYVLSNWIYGVEVSQPNKQNILFYILCIFQIILFAPRPNYAFSVGILSQNFTSLLFYLNKQAPYIIGGGDTFISSTIFAIFSMVLSFYLSQVILKFYPKASEMMFEASDEITPDIYKKKIKKHKK